MTEKRKYPVILTLTEDCTIMAEVPDMGIVTEGEDYEDAISMAEDTIEFTGVDMQDNDEEIPEPSALEKIDPAKSEFAEDGPHKVVLVEADFDEYREALKKLGL